MRAPDFWSDPPGPSVGLLASLLTPVGAALDVAGRLRRAVVRPYRAPMPVICVGNLVAGGSGKTPVALSLAGMLAGRGIATAIVMRGYGGRLAGPVRVDPQRHEADAVGDEPLLAATMAPCWVARDRAAGVRGAAADGAEVVILDDGFQNPHVAKDLSLVVVDAAYGFGNGRLIPAGPLREGIAAGLARADAIVLVGESPTDGPFAVFDRPVMRAAVMPVGSIPAAGTPVIAFAGIGRPEKFFATLRDVGVRLVAERGFPDHHIYQPQELAALHGEAEKTGALLLTTRKDWLRLPPADRAGIEALDVELRWRDPAAIDALLAPLIARAGDGDRASGD
ncbi:MAG TPA: tetraacyldisaccharide 4'-kinase [Stellaceae bacterium]|jgi:tetraacyldisaccharide 4'-kinase|nr:tetraacyldisaccharide 4'-kinase [Stellaceae bacterium]